MTKKKAVAPGKSAEIRKLLDTKKLIFGTERVIKQLKLGSIARVFVTSNCPDDVKEDIARYAGISKAAVVQLEISNDELGVVCKKPFSISVVGLLKG